MKLERSEDGWIVRVPDAVVAAFGLRDGCPVTLRPAVTAEDEVRRAIAEMRGRLPSYPFDRADWDGVDTGAIE